MRLKAGGIAVEAIPFGSMVTRAWFTLPNGIIVQPFFDNPWRDELDLAGLEPFVRNLGGEWPCVPFGLAHAPPGLPEDWQVPDVEPGWNPLLHGYGSHHDWVLERRSPAELAACIEYPDSMPVRRLERDIRLDPPNLALHFRLRVEARSPARVGIGVHPVFDLAGCGPRSCRLNIGGSTTAWSFPVEAEPGKSRFLPDQRGVPLEEMRDRDGDVIDGTRLPLDGASEDLLLLTEPGGQVRLSLPERGYEVLVAWDAADFPCCSLWYSNRGLAHPPWNGRVCVIGIEPTVAAFDLGQPHSLSAETPLTRAGVPTSVVVTPDAPWDTRYSIRLLPLPAAPPGSKWETKNYSPAAWQQRRRTRPGSAIKSSCRVNAGHCSNLFR